MDRIQMNQAEGVLSLSLNRPDLHNAFDDVMVDELTRALEAAGANPEVRVVVLTGNGINFSTGHDMAWLQAMAALDADRVEAQAARIGRMLHTLDTLPKPTIARVQGSAFGIGAALIACCDIACGVSGALFSFPDVRLGAVPAAVAPFVIRSLGARASRRYFVSAERFNAGKAKRLGLLHMVVEEEELDAVIRQQAGNLLANGPQAMAAAKALLQSLSGLGTSPAALALAASEAARVRTSSEGREGLAAFIEKRPPSWVG